MRWWVWEALGGWVWGVSFDSCSSPGTADFFASAQPRRRWADEELDDLAQLELPLAEVGLVIARCVAVVVSDIDSMFVVRGCCC